MIQSDQFTNMPPGLLVAFSSREDGSMLDSSLGRHHKDIIRNRSDFCERAGARYEDVVYQQVVYGEDQTYTHVAEVGVRDTVHYREGVVADALVTYEKGVGLFLPVADCVAAVVYDTKRHALALLHLGRHSTIANLMDGMLDRLKEQGSLVKDIRVWMAPSVSRASYRMEYFDHAADPAWRDWYDATPEGYYLDLSGYNKAVCLRHGVPPEHITVSPIDTAMHPQYFSHSQGDRTSRIALLAMIK